jgi:hypothetical protein
MGVFIRDAEVNGEVDPEKASNPVRFTKVGVEADEGWLKVELVSVAGVGGAGLPKDEVELANLVDPNTFWPLTEENGEFLEA